MTAWEQCLSQALAEVLEGETRELSTTSFAELGLDSLSGLRFMRKVEDLTGVGMELEWLFDYPTLGQLAQFLQERFGILAAPLAS